MSGARRIRLPLGIVALVSALSGAGRAQDFVALPPPPPPPPAVFGQTDQPPAVGGTALILGRVVDAATGRPLSGAAVRLNDGATPALLPTAPAAPLTPALTNSQGQFLFRGLAAGRYSLSAQFGGYLPGSYGQTRADGPSGQVRLSDAQRLTDVTIRLWKHGAITGRVLDEVGEPAVGLSVRVLRRSTVGRQNQWVAVNQATTDDRGIYRVGALVPGEFIVATTAGLVTLPVSIGETYMDAVRSGTMATLPPAMSEVSTSPAAPGSRIGDLLVQPLRGTLPPPPTSLDAVFAYQTVYHPAATRLADATHVRVGPGEEKADVDLQARLARMFRISGQVTGHDAMPMSAGLTLVPSDAGEFTTDAGFETASAVSDNDGRFTFLGVPPGQYTIRMTRAPRPIGTPSVMTTISVGGGVVGFSSVGANGPPAVPLDEPTLWAETPVSVSDDVEHVSVAVRSGARVRGTVEFDGPATPLEPRQRQQITISLVAASGRTGGLRQPPPGRVAADGTFATSQYPPGRYFVNVSAATPNWRVRSVMIGGRNALEEPFALGPTDMDGVAMTFTSRTTELAGTVRGSAGVSPHITVLIFPADHERWIANGMRGTLARTVATAADGSFHVSGLLPGAYRAVALPAGAPADVQDAVAIEALAGAGAAVTLVEGETRSVTLTVSAIR